MKAIVSGTGRCGTVYMAKLLTSLGIPCGHESIFNLQLRNLEKTLTNKEFKFSICSVKDHFSAEKLLPWLDLKTLEADSSYMSAPYLTDVLVKDVPLIHITRNPLEVISSFILDAEYFNYRESTVFTARNVHFEKFVIPYESFMAKYVPDMNKAHSPVEKACRFYIGWTRMIENSSANRPFLRAKIEDQHPVSQEVLDFLGIKSVPNDVFSNTKCNSWKKRLRDFTIVDVPKIIRSDFIENAERLGYKL